MTSERNMFYGYLLRDLISSPFRIAVHVPTQPQHSHATRIDYPTPVRKRELCFCWQEKNSSRMTKKNNNPAEAALIYLGNGCGGTDSAKAKREKDINRLNFAVSLI